MTRFTTFTDKELNDMEYVFCGVQDLTHLMEEIEAERGLREKAKEIENYKVLKNKLERAAMNSNYGVVTRSCDDDEKLVVLCMINKTLEDIQGTLEGMQEALARVDDKI